MNWKMVLPASLVGVVLLAGCSAFQGEQTTPVPTAVTEDEEALALERAEELSIAMQMIDSEDPEGWKDAVYPLCNADGQWQWEENFRRGFWDEISGAGHYVTDNVTVDSARFFTRPGSDGKIVEEEGQLVAFVITEGVAHHRIVSTNETRDTPFKMQVMLARDPGGGWLLALVDTVNTWVEE